MEKIYVTYDDDKAVNGESQVSERDKPGLRNRVKHFLGLLEKHGTYLGGDLNVPFPFGRCYFISEEALQECLLGSERIYAGLRINMFELAAPNGGEHPNPSSKKVSDWTKKLIASAE